MHQQQTSATPVVQQTLALPDQIKAGPGKKLKHEDIYNLPNFLTFSRLLAAPAVGYLILYDYNAWAMGLFLYAGITDLVDGWLARRWKQQTVVGSVVDPMADKALMTILTVCLAVQGTLPVPLAVIILGRDISLAAAAIYYRFASLPPPKTMARYWDFSLPSAEVHPTTLSKYNTFLQLVLIGATTALPVAGPAVNAFLIDHLSGLELRTIMTASQYLVGLTTIWSGGQYLWTRNAVKILGDGSEESKKRILRRGRIVLGSSFAICLSFALAMSNV